MSFGPWDPGPYWLVRFVLLRGISFLYLIAFLVALNQYRPLVGEDGILPMQNYIERWDFRERPSLFYFKPSDDVIEFAAWSGVLLSVIAISGLPSAGGIVGYVLVWGLLWVLYLSFVNAGQTFYGFGWESMLLETGFLAIFLGPIYMATPVIIIWLFRWLLFRNMFGAGLIKIRGDECWRDLTCMDYHYETQPMPNPISWFAHHFPTWLHRLAVIVNHFVELLVPVFYFAPQPIAAIAGIITIGFQLWLMLTGNFAFLNVLTLVLAFSTFSDDFITQFLPIVLPQPAPVSLPFQIAVWIVFSIVLILSYNPVKNMISSKQVMNTSFDPLNLVNTYGAFGSITKTRYEIVIEATDEQTVSNNTEWHQYRFKGKPTDISQRPPQVAPYHYRLDWQMWFAAMSPSPRRHPWFFGLIAHLLMEDQATHDLLESVPFEDTSPEYIRAVRYRYRFSTPQERKETGNWWQRERAGIYYGPVSLSDTRLQHALDRLNISTS